MTLTRRFLPPVSALCAFEADLRLQNFTAAAELNLTQSAVSRQIRQLECQGSPNFSQCGRSNFPTRLG